MNSTKPEDLDETGQLRPDSEDNDIGLVDTTRAYYQIWINLWLILSGVSLGLIALFFAIDFEPITLTIIWLLLLVVGVLRYDAKLKQNMKLTTKPDNLDTD